jgi:hypothetical protein
VRLRLLPLALLLLATPVACARAVTPARPTAAPRPATAAVGAPAADRPYLRARGDRFEIVGRDGARPVFLRGVNLGAGPPGHFPGEFAIARADYARWLRFARTLHANAIRVYALHPPDFYRALREENDAHPEDPIWLFQEVWTELPDSNDFWGPGFTRAFEQEIRNAVDAVHGAATIAPRPGHASGRYDTDVSMYLGGWLLGREWEPYAVRETDARHPERRSFTGTYFEITGGTAMETWLARICDFTAAYEAERHGLARAVSFVNWPTLDPMRHPTEYERGGREAEHDEDAQSVDPARIRARRDASRGSGFLGYFANYHVYPYYPDFMNLDPGYGAHRDAHGPCNYAAYLADLKAHTRGIPLLVGEYGVPNSRGVAHLQPQGIHHGGMSEEEQGRHDVRLLEDIAGTGCAGSLLFALFDEWFKVNWLVARTEQPRDRDPSWHNLLDPEECYGLIGFDPPSRVRIDGDTLDWAGIAPQAVAEAAGPGTFAPVRALYAAADQTRFYVRFDLAPGAAARETRALGVMLDVLDPARGDRRLPAPLPATWSRGAEFALVIEPRGAPAGGGRGAPRDAPRAALFIDAAMNYSTYARRLAGGDWKWHRAPFRPVANEDGAYIPLVVETNRERVGRDGRVYPALRLDWGRLSPGREPARAAAWPGADSAFAYDPRAEICADPSGRVIEVAIPWGLLLLGDPGARRVVDDRNGTAEVETGVTDGIGLLAWATRAEGFRADSLGPAAAGDAAARARVGDCQFLGATGTAQYIDNESVSVSSPEGESFLWNGWDMPITVERIKSSARAVRDAFEGMEARETQAVSSEEKGR